MLPEGLTGEQDMENSSLYGQELNKFNETFELAVNADIQSLKNAIAGASESSIIGVGSGGSYTVASLLTSLHETYTGRVSRPSTPLELISNPNLASSSPVFVISAEGKNPDAVEALTRARLHSSRTVHVITNKKESPLEEKIEALSNVNNHVFHLDGKDGYLATNSLLMDAILVARCYSELDDLNESVPATLDELSLVGETIDSWLASAGDFIGEVGKRKGIIIIYSPQLYAIAADLESKLSEGALTFSQVVDMRSFAHGRHLWCAARPEDCCILAITEPKLDGLWLDMKGQLPETIPMIEMRLNSAGPWDLIGGLVAQMKLVGNLADSMNKEIGKPDVPEFGRNIYYTELADLISDPLEQEEPGEKSQLDVLGVRWPSKPRTGAIGRARSAYKESVQNQSFRAIIFDYDGTLCSSQRKDQPPSEDVLDGLLQILQNGVKVGIASGRGDSINEILQERIPLDYREQVILGLYNGGHVANLGEEVPKGPESCEFLNHALRIVRKLQSLGVPIDAIRPTIPYQISIRFREGVDTETMWYVIGDSMRQAGLDPSRMVCSKHSIDILGDGISKDRVLAH